MFIPLTCTFYRILSSYARKKKKTGNTTYYKQMLHTLLLHIITKGIYYERDTAYQRTRTSAEI